MFLSVENHSNPLMNHIHCFKDYFEMAEFIEVIYENGADFWISSDNKVFIDWIDCFNV